MKNELKISIVSMICVLCASGMSGAYGASSVRTLGGAGTYASAASASQSGGGAGVARAGSVRVAPTTTKATTAKPTNSASVTAGRAATTSRLSLGKYLGGGTAISGGSSTRPGTGTSGGGASTTNPGLSADVANRLEVLEDTVADLKSVGEDLKENKQNKLSGDEYIEIDKNGNVSLIVDNLKEDLQGINGRDVVIGLSNDNKYIVWQNDGDSEWTKLIAIEELVGPQGEKGEKGEPGDSADMALYSTTEQMNLAIADAVNGFVTSSSLGTMLADFPTNDELNEKLATKVDASSVYDKTAADTKFATKEDLAGVETGAGTALTDALKNYATSADLAAKGVLDTISQDGKIGTTDNEDVVRRVYVDPNDPSNVKVASGKIGNKSIADNAEIARTKLATDVRVSLLNADSAVQPEDITDVERTSNLTQTVSGVDSASESKYTSEKAVATALNTKADTSALASVSESVDLLFEENDTINKALNTKVSSDDLDTLTEMVAEELEKKVDADNVYSKTEIDEKLVPVSGFEQRMADLTKTVEDNMQELQADMQIVNNINNTVSKIVNEDGDIVINATQIAPNSITAREIAPNSITNLELADNTVKLENLNADVSEQLVGAPKDEKDGMYVLLVTPSGERVWADLAMGTDEANAN